MDKTQKIVQAFRTKYEGMTSEERKAYLDRMGVRCERATSESVHAGNVSGVKVTTPRVGQKKEKTITVSVGDVRYVPVSSRVSRSVVHGCKRSSTRAWKKQTTKKNKTTTKKSIG